MSERFTTIDNMRANGNTPQTAEGRSARGSVMRITADQTSDASTSLIRHLLGDLQEWTDCEWAVAALTYRNSGGAVLTIGDVPNVNATVEQILSRLQQDMGDTDRTGLLIVPIRVSGEFSAGITLGPKYSGGEYTDADRVLIVDATMQVASLLKREALAGRIANRLLDLRRTREEMQTARNVQQCLLPPCLTRMNGVEYHGEWQPVHDVGGDFFDFIPVDSGVAVSIGDVAGNGIPAAILMAGTQASLRVLANARPTNCASVVTELNRLVCAISPDNRFATLFYGHLDTALGKLTYVNAGHEPAVLVRRRGSTVRVLECTGTVLGLSPRCTYAQRSVAVEPGDVLVAFTDGVSEGIELSTGELCHVNILGALQRCPDIGMHELVRSIMAAATEAGEVDDKAVIAIRVSEGRQQRVRACRADEFVAARCGSFAQVPA